MSRGDSHFQSELTARFNQDFTKECYNEIKTVKKGLKF